MGENARHPYSMEKQEKDAFLTEELKKLSMHHMENCPEYARILRAQGADPENVGDFRDLPFLPAGLFKRMRLSSLGEEDRQGARVLTSSGTKSQAVSQIILGGETRTAQQRALAEIGADFLGADRLPLLVIDCPSTVTNRERFSARTAGIQGFSLFGHHRTFALKEDMSPDEDAIREFLEKYGSGTFLVFGFTYIIWEHLYIPYSDGKKDVPDMSGAILIHGGGWKKLADLQIPREKFRSSLKETFGICRVHDYYGMAEQAGSIFMECEEGHFHCSDYSGVVVRRAEDFSICGVGEPGIIQVLSVLPKSYPGHSLLTEDEGVILGEDDCPCGRKGIYFNIIGRLKDAEIRGCSDTYEN